MLKRILALAVLGLVMAPGQAAEPVGRLTTESIIKRTLESRLSGARVDSVRKTPYAGLYEFRVDGRTLLYTDEKMSFIFSGSIHNGKNMQNLTEKRLAELTAIKWDDLPLNGAFKTVRGNGKRMLAVFSDPNCPYCKRFEKTLAQVDDITIYTFLYPILSQDSHDKARAVWCSADKVKAWDGLMLNGTVPVAADCDTPIERNLKFASENGITGTPTLFFASGARVPGAIPREKLEKLLDENGKR